MTESGERPSRSRASSTNFRSTGTTLLIPRRVYSVMSGIAAAIIGAEIVEGKDNYGHSPWVFTLDGARVGRKIAAVRKVNI